MRTINIPRRRKTDDNMIKQMYEEGYSSTEMAEFFGVTPRAIRDRYKKVGITGVVGKPAVYKINEQFFDTWNSEMAYVLGFILTDGCISKNTFSISQAEIEPLEMMRDMMESEHPIASRKNNEDGIQYHLTIGRKYMVERLAELGIHEKKSLTVGLPEVPDEFFADFLRGVIDGDGWVEPSGYSVVITSGSELFSNQLSQKMNDLGFPFRLRKSENVWRIILSGQENIMHLRDYLYYSTKLYGIQRKKERFDISLNFLKPVGEKAFGTNYTASDREKVKLKISEQLLSNLRTEAKKQGIFANRLLEKTLDSMLDLPVDSFNISKDRVVYSTSMNSKLLKRIRNKSREEETYISDIMEYAIGKIV